MLLKKNRLSECNGNTVLKGPAILKSYTVVGEVLQKYTGSGLIKNRGFPGCPGTDSTSNTFENYLELDRCAFGESETRVCITSVILNWIL